MRQYLVSTEKAPNPGQKLFKARVINATVPIEEPLEEKAQLLKTSGTHKGRTGSTQTRHGMRDGDVQRSRWGSARRFFSTSAFTT